LIKHVLPIVITGNPGVGKHTVARQLAKDLHLEMLDINKIAIEHQVFEKRNKTLDVDVKELEKILRKKITKNSLIVGHLAPYVLSRKQVDIVVVLRKSPYHLSSVYKKRNYTHNKSIENLGSEILGVTLYDTINKFGADKTFQIDTTKKSVSAITKKIKKLFVKRVCDEDEVDWLSLIYKKNDLKRFFPY
jgi:adenylate kinase